MPLLRARQTCDLAGRFNVKHAQNAHRLLTTNPSECPRSLAERSEFPLVARVPRLQLVPECQDEDDVFGRKPTIFRDISVTAAREDELAAALLGGSPEQWMIRQKLKRPADAQDLLTRSSRIFRGDEVKKSLEVGERSSSYLDGRHARALGRRALAPDARALK